MSHLEADLGVDVCVEPPTTFNIELSPTSSLGPRLGMEQPLDAAATDAAKPAPCGLCDDDDYTDDDDDYDYDDVHTADEPESIASVKDISCNQITPNIHDSSVTMQQPRRVVLSDRILRQVRKHHDRANRERQFSVRRIFAALLGIVPVGLFALEMIPERCNLCLDHVELDTYFVVVALCGGFGATLYSSEFWNYSLARFLGGSIGALGALFTVWMILQNVTSSLAFLFVVVGILGAMPGLMVYFLIKILSDECYVSDQQDFDDEFESLTKLRIPDV